MPSRVLLVFIFAGLVGGVNGKTQVAEIGDGRSTASSRRHDGIVHMKICSPSAGKWLFDGYLPKSLFLLVISDTWRVFSRGNSDASAFDW